MGNELEKKRFKLPHIFVLLTGIIIVAAILSWILPAGEFDRIQNAAGRTVVVPGTYHYIDRTPVGPFAAVMGIFNGLVNAADIVFFVFIAFASVGILIASGAFHGLIGGLLHVLKGNARLAIIPIFLAVLGLASSTIGVFEEALPFIPIFVGIAIGMGYDALVGLAIVAVGVGMGFSGAAMNPFTVGVAQSIAELPPLSGGLYRVICHLAMFVVASIYIIRYAIKVQKDPTKSLVYGEDFSKFTMDEKAIADHPFGIRQKLSLVAFFVTLGIFIWGVKVQGWYFGEIATTFLLMAVAISIIMGWSPNEFAGKIANGLGDICVACMMIGLARGIKVTLEQGHIIDTIVYGMSIPLTYLPKWLAGEAMLVVQTLLNFLIPSGSGQAATSMPIMAPLADLLGISRQVAVLAFQFGDGFSNILFPTAFAVVMAGIAGIKVTTWWKWLVPLFLLILLTQAVLIAIAIGIGW
ncbi:YfcC family protein [Treponema primitia]|uniref:YfcC family protein n=1 Tax=Treponema primitia TaxID=88058 RepID=UPI00025550B6|nr:TIGR00366 family protein [Treponema primitia]